MPITSLSMASPSSRPAARPSSTPPAAPASTSPPSAITLTCPWSAVPAMRGVRGAGQRLANGLHDPRSRGHGGPHGQRRCNGYAQFVLEMLLSDHPNACMTCEVNGACELQDLVYDYDVPWPEHQANATCTRSTRTQSLCLHRPQQCILCSRCIRACGEIQYRDVWSFAYRGFETMLVAGADQFLLDAR